MKYGRLTVIKDLGVHNKNRRVLCKCECGNTKDILLQSLKRGNTRSCGCLAKELRSKRLKEKPIFKRKPNGEAAFNSLYADYKNQAQKKNVTFDLNKKDFKTIINSDCYYCGEKPSRIRKTQYNTGSIKYNGIDRVNNNKGYTKENCVSCCKFCNIAKNNESLDYFLSKVEKIYNNLKKNEVISGNDNT